MTSSPRAERQLAGAISLPVVRAMLDDAAAHDYGPSHRDAATVLGIYADPSSIEHTTLEHRGLPVEVAPCVSALAVRQALLAQRPGSWLVVVTDRPEEDLGVGILAHLAGHKLRTPDPWESVRQQFAATGLEAALYVQPDSRTLANGLLLARPEDGWPPAPAGTLTRDHALGSVARAWLDVPRRGLDVLGVLRWTATPGLTGRIADFRAAAGDRVTDATLAWICSAAGVAEAPLRQLLKQGEIRDAVPLGVVLSLLVPSAPDGGAGGTTGDDDAVVTQHARDLGLARLAHRWHGSPPSTAALRSLGEAATQVVSDLVHDRSTRDVARQLLNRADALLAEIDADALAERSDVLPSGLTARLLTVAERLRSATLGPPDRADEPDAVSGQVARHTQQIELAWAAVGRHVLGDPEETGRGDARLGPVQAAVRLSRWLALPTEPAATDLATLALRQGVTDAWVDAAANDAHEGVSDARLAEGLTAVLALVQAVRDVHDRAFGSALARAVEDDAGSLDGYLAPPGGTDRVWLLEHLLRGAVVPVAKATPTLLLVLDGMSTAVATEVVSDVLGRGEGWQEALLPEAHARATGLSVLPSLTEVSRASLLCGELTTGGQDREQSGYAALVSALGLRSPKIFHKKPLDSSQPGFAVADDVALAISDTSQQLVTCVLNTIDDALDRSDPAGTVWTADAVKHLRPLLERAFAAGRTVILTADHGHVVERRMGTQRSAPDISSGRSRAADPPPGPDEVLVSGTRVLKHGGRAVLPVSERLRYGPLKAGYHGGATPAEVVVPVVVLVPGPQVPDGSDLRLARQQTPRWWSVAPVEATTVEVDAPSAHRRRAPRGRPTAAPQEDALFDTSTVASTPPPAAKEIGLGEAILRSEVFEQQKSVAGRLSLDDAQVQAALEALAAAPGTRLGGTQLAGVLGLSPALVRGATAQLAKLLNVESYPVIRTEGATVILDVPLLREQFIG
ncbi:BREX-2 system phosphatase PglZ [Serinicoccus chungangensis]|uniref:BREX-2 system phosphatase PglZ n=1 Tax=Serinicoccus chungangensis TaxID=767452 RepID=UPI00111B1197|nr:BREX-2 system phosphatase PglZ [Serinicoccus chungangensis]